jgi:hypothetical protein
MLITTLLCACHCVCTTVILLFEVLEDDDSIDDDSRICLVLELMQGPTMVHAEGTADRFIAETGECGVWPESSAKVMFRDLCSGMYLCYLVYMILDYEICVHCLHCIVCC